MSTTITDLPLEVLCRIVTLLPYNDISSVRLVCHRFYSATQQLKILDKELLIFDEEYYCFQPASLLKSNRSFLHMRLQNYKSFSYDYRVWSHIGPELKSLSLVSCKLTKQQLLAILSNCTNLINLEISSCSIAARSTYESIIQSIGLPFKSFFSFQSNINRYSNLKKLKIHDGCILRLDNLENFRVEDGLDAKLLKKILNSAPNLKSHETTGSGCRIRECKI